MVSISHYLVLAKWLHRLIEMEEHNLPTCADNEMPAWLTSPDLPVKQKIKPAKSTKAKGKLGSGAARAADAFASSATGEAMIASTTAPDLTDAEHLLEEWHSDSEEQLHKSKPKRR